ncbi:CDP-glycerol glycerophosphotransferase, TagB/SpsB family [Desulfonatronum thiosulfatophilum]|uniref:CDP-glycerol glycerophosphotransferase, TagB/SpsB family n=2 Tax=Desulfonatronum thiosulfatophilum TaxID=617002 RepID=A0A1G6DUM1_9BACT|nr:CDP-glycerol glycerophosphotransferase, TagB/SpsB family [Desulfonatronum thiosulfatophilum]
MNYNDMHSLISIKIDEHLPSFGGCCKFLFSVVTAVYNAEPWIETLLDSLTKQSLDFETNIQIVLIDDGSTDETADIIHNWVVRFPRNIMLLRQENSGPALARNRGLELASGQWVTFIDADDFVSPLYFQIVHDFLNETQFDGPVIACNLIFYFDAVRQAVDCHGLNYKFAKTHISNLLDEPDNIQLSLSSCFISSRLIKQSMLKIDERIRPTFEDAHFLNLYLLHTGDFRVAFLKDAHYYYRRRGAGAGLVEGGWAKSEKYHDQILFGFLNLVQQYQRTLNSVPEFIQNLIIYESHWYMTRLLEGLSECPLSSTQRESFFELMRLLFRHIEVRQILLSNLPVLELRTRIAMLKAFKGARFNFSPPVATDISADGREVQLSHWSTDEAIYRFCDCEHEISITWSKRIVHQLGGTVLSHEYRCWLPLSGCSDAWLEIDGQRTGIFCRDRIFDKFNADMLRQFFFLPMSALSAQQNTWLALGKAPEATVYDNCWILMDRVHKADDNAEHFCRWLREHYPKQPVYFVLDRKSKDWGRLEREGFPLLAYRSNEHFAALSRTQWLISSHVDLPVTDPMGTKALFGLPRYKIAFLQHGITKEDISGWLNEFNLDCIVTSTQQEYESMLIGRYKFSARELVLTGFPRHDTLLQKSQTRKPSRTILICPTWREHLRRTEAHLPGVNQGEVKAFQESDFFHHWNKVTSSRTLARITRNHGYRLLFLPHPEVVRFLHLFQRSEAFSFLSWTDVKSVQDLMVSSSMIVTDYSSIVFDMAYIGRPVAYYQFPEMPGPFSSRRTQGYFSYKEHGLGPVLNTLEALEEWLSETLSQGCVLQEPYISRADAFFTFCDGHNCRRIYDEILRRSK